MFHGIIWDSFRIETAQISVDSLLMLHELRGKRLFISVLTSRSTNISRFFPAVSYFYRNHLTPKSLYVRIVFTPSPHQFPECLLIGVLISPTGDTEPKKWERDKLRWMWFTRDRRWLFNGSLHVFEFVFATFYSQKFVIQFSFSYDIFELPKDFRRIFHQHFQINNFSYSD